MSNKEIASLIVDFIQTKVKSNEINEDYHESMDVVINCLCDAFEIEAEDAVKVKKEVFNNTSLEKMVKASKEAPANAADGVPVVISSNEKENKEEAESLKAEGNKAVAARDFDGAIEKYTKAIELVGNNAVYYSNRAFAYSSVGKHNLAIKDAEKAIELDANYPRAYSRLGLACFALGDTKGAVEAYGKGLEVEGDNPSAAMKKGYETAKKKLEEQAVGSSSRAADSGAASTAGAGGMPDLSSLASMFGGMGGAGGAGGMPDLAGMMNNPQLMESVQGLMQNPEAMSNLMNNPMVRQMAQNFGLGGAGGAGGSN